MNLFKGIFQCLLKWNDGYLSQNGKFQDLFLSLSTGTPRLTRFFGPEKNRVKGKPRYRRSILLLKPGNMKAQSPLFSEIQTLFLGFFIYLIHPFKEGIMTTFFSIKNQCGVK